MILFETMRLYVRHWTLEDLQNNYALYSDPAVMRFIRAALTLEETQHILTTHLRGYTESPHKGRFAVIEKGTESFIGTFLLKDSDSITGLEIGYAFLQQCWGKGYATELVEEGVKFAFKTHPIDELYAITELHNEASRRVLGKCGFKQMDNIVENGKEVNLFFREVSRKDAK